MNQRNAWGLPHLTPKQRIVLWLTHYATQRGNPLRVQARIALLLAEWIGRL